jgi:hypothetical protein
MATYTKYDTAIQKLCDKLIDAFGTTDVWKAVIHTDAPTTATDSVLTDLIEIGNSNGYTSGGLDITFNSTRSGGTVTATAVDTVWTAVTGNLGTSTTGRYVSVYDFTSSAKDLWCSWDYGSTFTVAVGETFTLDFGASFWTIS